MRILSRKPDVFICDKNNPPITKEIPVILLMFKNSSRIKYAITAVITGIKFVNALALPIPIRWIEKVKNINAKDDPKIANLSKGIHASEENPDCLNSGKSTIKKNGAKRKMPMKLW